MKHLLSASCSMRIQKTRKGRPIKPIRVADVLLCEATPRGFALRRFAVPA